MRRAVLVLLALAAFPAAALAYKPGGPVDAIGMLDYRQGPRFKVGDWVRYQTKGESAQGFKTDYVVTILIAGEELWWGEECFWVETQTRYSMRETSEITASLVSYAVFDDSLPNRHFQRYIRKFSEGFDEKGMLIQQPFLRASSELVNRGYGEYEPLRTYDTLGVETIDVPIGKRQGMHTREIYREAVTKQYGDSTVFFEVVENQDYWRSKNIPITGLLKLAQDNSQRRRAWKVGESADAPLLTVEHTVGGTTLLEMGSGMHSQHLPMNVQRPLREQLRTTQQRKPAGSPPRKGATSGRN